MNIAQQQKLFNALKRIAHYDSPERLHRSSQKIYGLRPYEAIEYAYENVIQEAKIAIKGMRFPKDKTQKGTAA